MGEQEPNALGVNTIVEKDSELKTTNVHANLVEGKIRVIRSTYQINK